MKLNLKKIVFTQLTIGFLFGCNYGVVDIQHEEKICNPKTYRIYRDTVIVDTATVDCGDTKITTPLDRYLKPIFN